MRNLKRLYSDETTAKSVELIMTCDKKTFNYARDNDIKLTPKKDTKDKVSGYVFDLNKVRSTILFAI